jgi:hypothetical protein
MGKSPPAPVRAQPAVTAPDPLLIPARLKPSTPPTVSTAAPTVCCHVQLRCRPRACAHPYPLVAMSVGRRQASFAIIISISPALCSTVSPSHPYPSLPCLAGDEPPPTSIDLQNRRCQGSPPSRRVLFSAVSPPR